MSSDQMRKCCAHYSYNDRDNHFNDNHKAETCPFKGVSNNTFVSREALQDHLENHCSSIPYCCLVCNDQGLTKAIKNKTFGEDGEHECYPGLVTTYNYSNPAEVRAVFQALSAEITSLKTEMKKLRIQLAEQSSQESNAKHQQRYLQNETNSMKREGDGDFYSVTFPLETSVKDSIVGFTLGKDMT